MKAFVAWAAVLIVLGAATGADAKGCLKGAAVGGVAGHYAGHHGLLGAAAGCAIGRHEANKRDRMQRNQIDQPDRDLRNGEERSSAIAGWQNLSGLQLGPARRNALDNPVREYSVGSMKRTILKAFLEPFVIVVAAVYFVIDALALSILKPLLRKIANLKVLKFIARWIASLGPYPRWRCLWSLSFC